MHIKDRNDYLAQQAYDKILDILITNDKDVSEIKLKPNVTDYSIYFFNTLAIKLKFGKNHYMYIKDDHQEFFPPEYTFQKLKSLPDYVHFELDIDKDLERLADSFVRIYEDIKPLTDTFGCCSSYVLCSDELKCVHPDPTFARGCSYKTNLEHGRVFYGKNRNC